MKLYCRADELPPETESTLSAELERLKVPYERFDKGIIVDCEGDYDDRYMQVVLAFEMTMCERVVFYRRGMITYGKRQT